MFGFRVVDGQGGTAPRPDRHKEGDEDIVEEAEESNSDDDEAPEVRSSLLLFR
jgi:hypothetical protein